MKRFIVASCSFFVSATLVAPAPGHADDPKMLDKQPRYEGPGWRPGDGAMRGGFASSGVTLLSWLSLPDFGSPANGNSVFGYVSPSGREYAIMGLSTGTAFVEITDPNNPDIVAQIAGPNSLWRDMKVYGTHCYAISEGGSGIQVIDMGNIDNGVVTFVRNVTTGGTTTATHTLAVDTDSGYLYRAGGSFHGLRIYSLANPSNPAYVTSWDDRYVHEAQVVTYTSGPLAGKQLAFCCGGLDGGQTDTAIDILDVTNKGAIALLSRTRYGSSAYSHQAWLSPDRKHLYHNDELDDGSVAGLMRIFNVEDPANVQLVGTHANSAGAIDHNLYTRSSIVYRSNYRSGLRVVDASVPTAPVEVAFFDTYPTDDGQNFNGLWNNYPYFPSGVVIGSDIERGLFVWRVTGVPIAFYFPDGVPSTINPIGGAVNVEITGVNGGAVEPGTPTLHYDNGSGPQSTTLISLGGDLYQAVLPATACGETISFHVSAESTSGIVRTSPVSGDFEALASAGSIVSFSDNMETNLGWSVNPNGTDNATTGAWTRVNPNGTTAQPEDDHSNPGTIAWVTGQGSVGGGVGDADVDNGRTTLQSPLLDLTGLTAPRISYWRWYNNSAGGAPNADIFEVEISNNNGGAWVDVETVGPTGPDTAGGWVYHEFAVADIIAPTAQMRMRFIASDLATGSIVEAAVDDFAIADLDCGVPCPADLDGSGAIDLPDVSILLGSFGTTGADPEDGDLDGDGDVDLVDLSLMLASYGTSCP